MITVNSGFPPPEAPPKFPWQPLVVAALVMFLACLALGCATVTARNRECRDGIVGLTSEVMGWEGPPAAAGVPKTVKVTAHNGSAAPVRFTMSCSQVGRPATEIDVRLDALHDKFYYFTMRFNPWEERTTFACLITRFGDHDRRAVSWSTTTDRSTP